MAEPVASSQRSLPKTKALRSLLLGGVIPVVAFTVIESQFGIVWGLVAGMVFGLGEIFWEWRTTRHVEPLTWGGNGMILVLGGLSLATQEGIWFKLQPSLIEAAMALLLWGSVIAGHPLLVSFMSKAMKQQGISWDQSAALSARGRLLTVALRGLTMRLGLFFAIHAAVAAWAALYWSTAAWALLKGVGFTLTMIVYMVVESLVLRYRIATK